VVSGSEFRLRLVHALMRATGLSIVGSAALAGCGTTEERCFYWPEKAETVGCGANDVTCDEVGGSHPEAYGRPAHPARARAQRPTSKPVPPPTLERFFRP